MSAEFKVMPWLRALRDKHAAEQAGLNPLERLEQDRKRTADPEKSLFRRRIVRPEANAALSRVAERNAKYGDR